MSSLPCPIISTRCGWPTSVMTTLLLQAVHDTLRTLLADPKYLRAQPGIPPRRSHLESDPGAASACALPGDGCGRTSDGALEGRPYRLSAPRTRHHGGISGASCLALFRRAFAQDKLQARGHASPAVFNLLNRLGHAQKTRGMCTFGSAIATEPVWSRIWLATCGAA